MTVIDMHAHAFPDDIAARAIDRLTSMAAWEPCGDGTVSDTIRSMDAAGVAQSAVCGIATRPGQAAGILRWLTDIAGRYPDRLLPFASLHPADPDPAAWLSRFADCGIRAIKLHAFYQDFAVDDEGMFPLYEAAADRDFLVTFHAGRDIGFMDDARLDRVSPRRIATVLDRFPAMRVLCTHMGGWKMWDEVEAHLAGRRLWVETSYTMPFVDADLFKRLVAAYGPARVCFGTDWPWQDRSAELDRLRAMAFDPETLEMICGKNAARLLDY